MCILCGPFVYICMVCVYICVCALYIHGHGHGHGISIRNSDKDRYVQRVSIVQIYTSTCMLMFAHTCEDAYLHS